MESSGDNTHVVTSYNDQLSVSDLQNGPSNHLSRTCVKLLDPGVRLTAAYVKSSVGTNCAI